MGCGCIRDESKTPKKSNYMVKIGGFTLGKSYNLQIKTEEMEIEDGEVQSHYNSIVEGGKANHTNTNKNDEIGKSMNNQTQIIDKQKIVDKSKKTEVNMKEETKIKNSKNIPNISLIGQPVNLQNKRFNEIAVENSYIQEPYNYTIKDFNNNILDSSKNVYIEQNLNNKKEIEKFKK